jgi:murein DD-endopeptidase MepM/ murein hydrolase activator NlpD
LTSFVRTRAIAYGAMALFFVVTARLQAQTPGRSQRERFDTLGSRETLVHVLGRAGLPAREARLALATKLLTPGSIKIGMPVHTRSGLRDTMPTEVRLGLAIDRFLVLRRGAESWTGSVDTLPWTADTIMVTGKISTHLTAAVAKAAQNVLGPRQREQLTYALADLYEFRVDMSRDLRVGDSFLVVAERETGPGGAVRVGKVIAATMTVSRTTIDAIPFKSAGSSSEFFDAEGRPLRCCFLRAPLEFRRISSGFGTRRHPILGNLRRHEGTDYAASAGTPVRAIGDGVVIKAGWTNGYGNTLELRHPNGFVTRYGHLQGFAKGITRGVRVPVTRVVAYVGSTGLSTGPHLHFEVLVNGTQRNPRTALGSTASKPIPESERKAFAVARDAAQALLREPERFASADTSSSKRGTQQ